MDLYHSFAKGEWRLYLLENNSNKSQIEFNGNRSQFPIIKNKNKKVKNDHSSKFSNLSNWKEEAWKKNQGFNGIRTRGLRVAGALRYQLSYEATHWGRGQFIEKLKSCEC